jgi:hypothetical protein
MFAQWIQFLHDESMPHGFEMQDASDDSSLRMLLHLTFQQVGVFSALLLEQPLRFRDISTFTSRLGSFPGQ